MKKLSCCVCSLLLIILLVAGCGGNAAGTVMLSLATGGSTGTYYSLGGALGQLWNSKAGKEINVTAQSTGATIENLNLLNKGDAELAIAQSDIMDFAFKGTEMFKAKLPDVRAVAYLYPEIIQLVVRDDGSINSVADLKGKRVGVGAPGSGTEANFRQIIDVFGLTYKDLNPQYLSFGESADKFKDNQIDAFLVVAGLPNNAIMDVSTQHNIKILGIDPEMIAKINQKYPFLNASVISAGTYRRQTIPVNTVAVMATLVASAKLPDATVYTITKTLFDNLEEIGKMHNKGKEIKLDIAVKGMNIPLHPGAEKYFKEKGILK